MRFYIAFTFGGRFAMSTMSVCSTAFEKRGPMGVQSVHTHMSTISFYPGWHIFPLTQETLDVIYHHDAHRALRAVRKHL